MSPPPPATRRTPFRFAPPTYVDNAGRTVDLLPLLRVRYVTGKEEKVSGDFRFSLEPNSGDGQVDAASGRLRIRSTPGTMVVRATHASSGEFCLLSVRASQASGGQVEEPDDDEGPEPAGIQPIRRQRHFFVYGADPADLGTRYTATMEVVSSEIIAKCEEAARHRGAIIGAQGTYSLYRAPDPITGTVDYQRDLYAARVESHAPYADQLLAFHEAGVLLGIQACDDFAGDRWKTGGLPVSELSWMASKWAEVVPGVPILLRARPRQFTTEVPQGYTGMIVQHRYWGGLEAPAQFRDAEQALAKARGHMVYWSMNYLHGGGLVGGVKQPMSPAQIREAGLAFAGADPTVSLGIGGWKDDSMLAQPEYQAVLGEIRELMNA